METEQIPTTASVPRQHTRRPADAPAPAPGGLVDRAGALWALLRERPVSLYAASALRIGYGLLYLVFLLREFPHRETIWGPDSPWTPKLARELFGQTGWASVLTLSDNHAYFEICYTSAVVVSALYALGWRTRAMSVLFAVMVASFHARAILMTDGGDNLVLLMAIYLVFTACGRRWSLDARRVRLRSSGGGSPRRAPFLDRAGAKAIRRLHPLAAARENVTAVLHNCAMLVIAGQLCVLYGSAGLYKVQGGTWGNGTALHYVLNLDLFQPWPALSHLVDAHAILIAVIGYLTVLVQVAFPFALFSRLKYPVLVILLGMHAGIAVLMGLPLFSGAMIIADAAFLPDRFYRSLGALGHRALRAVRPSGPACEAAAPGDEPAGQRT